MFHHILIEEELKDLPQTKKILKRFQNTPYSFIKDFDEHFNQTKRPYLHKRNYLNLILASKKGQRVKEAPDAYGLSGEKHFYFIHAYNCIYECEYCYLQGHFNSPDIVLFLNHEDILNDMQLIIDKYPKDERIWFHAGEFSDSLALSHLTNEIEIYAPFFQKNKNAILELRTKSANTRSLEALTAVDNIITSFSLAPEESTKLIDRKTAPLKARVQAMKRLQQKGHPLGLHFDPMIFTENFKDNYLELIDYLNQHLDFSKVAYASLGVVRFGDEIYRHVQNNYPDQHLFQSNMIKSFDHKMRYPRPLRMWMMNQVHHALASVGLDDSKIYRCME